MKAQKRPYRNAAYCRVQIRPQGIDSYSIPQKGQNMDIYKQKKREGFLVNAEKEMYRDKQYYVERILAPAVVAAGAGVIFLSYEREESTEIVTINYYGGDVDRINVTYNSLLAIMHEVVREIDGHHAHGHISNR